MAEEGSYIIVPLHAIAHSRAGDKGNRVNISAVAYRPEFYTILLEQATALRVSKLFGHRGQVKVTRYELPNLKALNFVVDNALEGGVNRSLNLDGHGKALSFLLLSMPVKVPRDLAPLTKGHPILTTINNCP
jgi:hypothetical protein